MHREKYYKGMALAILLISSMILFVFPSFASDVRTPDASGTVTYGNGTVCVDASNASDGYLMIKYTGRAPKIKVRITNTTEYTYDLNTSGQYETFPLTEGNGSYTVMVFENISGTMYSTAFTQKINVTLTDANSPFLYPNQFCNFNASSEAVKTGDTLVEGKIDTLSKVEAIYNYTIENVSYDYDKAQTVRSGYLPNVDDTLQVKKGICFDYAALMASMLRTQNIPTKLVIGYAGDKYHAWISVYSTEQGWINNVIQFDGINWKLMDPTFASSGKNNPNVIEYINNPANYTVRFTY